MHLEFVIIPTSLRKLMQAYTNSCKIARACTSLCKRAQAGAQACTSLHELAHCQIVCSARLCNAVDLVLHVRMLAQTCMSGRWLKHACQDAGSNLACQDAGTNLNAHCRVSSILRSLRKLSDACAVAQLTCWRFSFPSI